MQKILLGQRIREVRERQGMSQVALAKALGASINAINMLEGGATQAPHIDRLVAIADLFGVSLDYLAGRTDDPSPLRRHTTTAPLPPRQPRTRTRRQAAVPTRPRTVQPVGSEETHAAHRSLRTLG